MRKLIYTFSALSIAIFLAIPTAAHAAPLFGFGTISHLEDEDFESVLDSDGNFKTDPSTPLAEGDLIAGVIKIQQLKDAFPGTKSPVDLQNSPDTFTAIFLLRVADIQDVPLGTSVVFGAAAQADWNDIYGTGGAIDVGMGLTPFDLSDDGTMAFVYDGIQFFDANGSEPGGPGASASTFVDGGRLLYEFGFTGTDGEPGSDEFWTTTGLDADIPSTVITNRPTTKLSLNVTAYHAGIELVAHNFLGNSGDATFTGPAQIQGIGTFEARNANSQWQLQTDTDLYVSVIPEPASLTLLLVGGLAVVGYRRRRQINKSSNV